MSKCLYTCVLDGCMQILHIPKAIISKFYMFNMNDVADNLAALVRALCRNNRIQKKKKTSKFTLDCNENEDIHRAVLHL